MLVDKKAVLALYDTILYSEGGWQRGPRKTLLFHVYCKFTHRVLLTKLVELDGHIILYLMVLIVDAQAWAGEALVMLEGK